MIEIIRWPKEDIKKFTFFCNNCETQWICDIGDVLWIDNFCSVSCPICGSRNTYYNNYRKGQDWDEFYYGYKRSYEIPILDGKEINTHDYCRVSSRNTKTY